MKKYVKDYLEHLGTETPLCEVCGRLGKEIHHIEPKGMGGSKKKDGVDNLICLCLSCHRKSHFQEKPYLTKEVLKKIKNENINNASPETKNDQIR